MPNVRQHLRLALAIALLATVLVAMAPPEPARAALGTPCQPTGTWVAGELNVFWFDVEQGDAQLLVGPTGTTMLIDLGENVWNRTTNTNAQRVAAEIQAICDVTGPVHLDYVMVSHHHLDHIGYAGNPHDTSSYGNGLYELLDPAGLDFSVGTLIDRDGGVWNDSNGDGDCEVGTNASPSPDIEWHDVGTQSSTARRWICWLYGPSGQPDRANIDGRVLQLTNGMASWPVFDLGGGMTAEVVQANAKGVMQADGVTPVSGNHVNDATPPSENDYSVAVRVAYGDYDYATAGDADGEYSSSPFGYSYNDIEASIHPLIGDVDTMRVNHHGSSHSTSGAFTAALAPETAVISCGSNSYGHPADRVLDELRTVTNDAGTGADIYATNNPCDTSAGIDYSGVLNNDGTIHAFTTGGGTGYDVVYDAGSRSYVAGSGGGGGPTPDVTITEARFRGSGGAADELIEIRNVGTATADISGWALEGCAGGSGNPTNRATVPSGTSLAAGQYYLFANASYTGSVAADLTYASGISDSGGARLVDAGGAMVDGVADDSGATDQCREGTGLPFPSASADESFHRGADGATDTDDNLADFAGPSASTPVNSTGAGGGGQPGSVGDIVINEYVPDNASFATEWVELHNPTASDVDVSGLWIDDIASGGSAPKEIAAGTIIPAGGHHVVTWSGYVLNNGGDDVRLLSADQATVYDSHSYSGSADDQSYRRDGDGGAWCAAYGAATQGTANPTGCP